jgi:hypothetical protein
MAHKNREYGPSEFHRRLSGLVAAAKRIQVEEKIERVLGPQDTAQLKLFDKMKSEDSQYKM